MPERDLSCLPHTHTHTRTHTFRDRLNDRLQIIIGDRRTKRWRSSIRGMILARTEHFETSVEFPATRVSYDFFFFFFPFLQRSLVIVSRRELKYYTRNKTSTKHRTKSIGRFTKHALRTSDIILYPSTYTRDESKTDKTARLFTFIRVSRSRSFSLEWWMMDDPPISLTSTNYFNDISQSLIDFAGWNRFTRSPDRIICKL